MFPKGEDNQWQPLMMTIPKASNVCKCTYKGCCKCAKEKLRWLARPAKKSWILLLEEASNRECIEGCNGEWLVCAMEVLRNNSISSVFFSATVKELLSKGRGKNRNLVITRNANCVICNPAIRSFAWVGVDNAECIFLNDFHWSSQFTPWHNLLLMLEWKEMWFICLCHKPIMPKNTLTVHTSLCTKRKEF